MNKCRLSAADLGWIARLTRRVSAQIGADDITRSVMLRALLHKGLSLSQTREVTGEYLSHAEPAKNISFKLTAEHMEQLKSLLGRIQAQQPSSGATLKNIQRPILRMALAEVEKKASFLAFSKAVRLGLPPPSARARARLGAAQPAVNRDAGS